MKHLSDYTIQSIIRRTFNDELLIKAIASAVDEDDDAYQLFYRNPYNFIRLLKNYKVTYNFSKADTIAKAFGYSPDSEERIRALLYYDLNTMLSDGSTIVDDYHDLVHVTVSHDPVNLTFDRVEAVMRAARGLELHEDSVQFAKESYYEETIARSVVDRMMVDTVDYDDEDIEQAIAEVETMQEIRYDDSQIDAIKFAVRNPVVILTGGPGTGKTTAINGIIHVLKILEQPRMMLMAPTGRAATRMTEAIGEKAFTIHKALSIPVYATGDTVFGDNSDDDTEPYTYDLTVVDEFSMVDVGLAYHIFSRVPISSRLICVGDVDQLEPVGHGQVLFDLMQNDSVPVVRLSVVHRQGEGSMISELARLANNGAFPPVIGETDQTYFRHMYGEQIDDAIEKDYCAMINSGKFKPEEIQILSPVRQGLASVKSLNERIQTYWRSQGELSAEFVYANGYQIREGDRVMITTSLPNEGLVNGDIGYVMHIGAREIVVEIGGDLFKVPRIRANNGRKYFPLELAYAITTHKSQGGEFPLVLYALRPGVDYWAKRNALYTAITRAKKYLVMYGDVDTYVRVALQEGNRRKTRLQWALSEALENALFFSYDF